MAAQFERVVRAKGDASAEARGDARSASEAEWQAAIAAQDDAEMLARRWGPEPEFMLAAGVGHAY
jgi:hypothetical protein